MAIVLLAVLTGLAGLAWALLPRADLAPLIAARIEARLGRGVAIDSLRVVPGRIIELTLHRFRLANVEGGSQPDMAEIETLRAEVEAWPLLRGAVLFRRLEADGATLLLERGPDGRGNWSFGLGGAGDDTPPPREGIPAVLDFALSRGEVVVRTRSGRTLTTRIDHAALAAPDSASPATLRAEGAYGEAPIALQGRLGSFTELNTPGLPFPLALEMRSGEARLALDGTATDPVNFDGIAGRLSLEAPRLGEILHVAGIDAGSDVPVAVAADATREGDDWRFADLSGTLDGHRVAGPLVRFLEGGRGEADTVEANLAFEKLDLARFLATLPDRDGGEDDGLVLPKVLEPQPDPMFRGDLTAEEIALRHLHGTDATLKVDIGPGRVVIETITLSALGGRIEGQGTATLGEGGATVEATLSGSGTTIDQARRAARIEPLPIAGPFDLRATVSGTGATPEEAERNARIVGVLSMQGGSIARELVEQVSTDVRALFRSGSERARIHCLLGVVDTTAGRGDISGVRLSTTAGTVVASGSIDAVGGRVDARIGSVSETTSGLALDVPVRVSGALADPSIGTTEWPRADRARFSVASRARNLPPPLREIAEANPCYGAAR